MMNKLSNELPKEFDQFQQKLDAFVDSDEQHVLPVKNGTKKDVLFLGATHGDEKVGIKSLERLEESNKFDWLLVNEAAYKEGKRFLEIDMNRSARGNIDSDKHEERRVAEILRKFDSYNYVVDIHGTVANAGLFIILTKLSFDDLLLALQFDIPNIVIWLPKEKKSTGPLVEFAQPGIEIECGPKDSEAVTAEVTEKMKSFLNNYNKPITKDNLKGKSIFWVDGKIEKSLVPLKDFELTEVDGEEFYPLLVGEYGISCYKMKKIYE